MSTKYCCQPAKHIQKRNASPFSIAQHGARYSQYQAHFDAFQCDALLPQLVDNACKYPEQAVPFSARQSVNTRKHRSYYGVEMRPAPSDCALVCEAGGLSQKSGPFLSIPIAIGFFPELVYLPASSLSKCSLKVGGRCKIVEHGCFPSALINSLF
jgi:hypothetical protein